MAEETHSVTQDGCIVHGQTVSFSSYISNTNCILRYILLFTVTGSRGCVVEIVDIVFL